MSPTYIDKIRGIAITAFEVVCHMLPVEQWEEEAINNSEDPFMDIQSVVLFSGAAEGGMIIKPSENLFNATAANMLGVREASEKEKKAALCELANIICGNTVPLFTDNEEICTISPPTITGVHENHDIKFEEMSSESFILQLDEGVAEILIFYNQ